MAVDIGDLSTIIYTPSCGVLGWTNGVVPVADRQAAQSGLRRGRPTRTVRGVSQRSFTGTVGTTGHGR